MGRKERLEGQEDSKTLLIQTQTVTCSPGNPSFVTLKTLSGAVLPGAEHHGWLKPGVDVGEVLGGGAKTPVPGSVWRKGLLQRDKGRLQGGVLQGFHMLL